jgi:hypothetical protein
VPLIVIHPLLHAVKNAVNELANNTEPVVKSEIFNECFRFIIGLYARYKLLYFCFMYQLLHLLEFKDTHSILLLLMALSAVCKGRAVFAIFSII